MTNEFIPAMEYFQKQNKKHIIVHVDNFVLEFDSTADVIEFVNAYTKAKKAEEQDDNQSI